VTACVRLLDRIQRVYGMERLWSAPGTRPEWFDKLFGTDRIRKALLAGVPGSDIASSWNADCDAFMRARAPDLLYCGAEQP
jgi:hypothetical protein